MRLGVVLTGTGVYGAAGAGVLAELMRRQMEPYAVCGLGTGAWPAALFAAGCDAQGLEAAAAQAQRMGKRMLRRTGGFFRGTARAVYTGAGMERLLNAQTRGKILALCPRRAVFLLHAARMERGLAFSTQTYAPGKGMMLTMQASVSFAARAAMSLPPYLAPLEWMGSPVLPVHSMRFAARQLFCMGAQRVLIVKVRSSVRKSPDALEMTAACAAGWRDETEILPGTASLIITMPEQRTPLSYGEITACMDAGKKTAERELDHLLECMGMAFCKVLPFRRDG